MTSEGSGPHLATVSHDGRFWDVYLDFEHIPSHPESHRGCLRFSPSDGEPREGVRTTTILIEESQEQVVAKARGMGEHMLVALLRSLLPE